MRAIVVVFALVAGCGPGAGAMGGVPPGYNPSCAPVGTATLTALAIGHADGRPYAVGDVFDTVTGGQGLTMAHFRLLLTGQVPSCVEAQVTANYASSPDAHAVTAADGGGTMEYYMGPIDLSQSVHVTASVAGMTASLTAGSTVFSIQ